MESPSGCAGVTFNDIKSFNEPVRCTLESKKGFWGDTWISVGLRLANGKISVVLEEFP